MTRNVLIDERLATGGLQSVDVIGDGYCAFKSIAVCLTGTRNSHLHLRRDIVRYMIRGSAGAVGKSSSAAADLVCDHLSNMSRNGVWVGEDVICAAATFLDREIRIYTATSKTGSLIYRPNGSTATVSAQPLIVAFYEPGYYKATFKLKKTSSTTANPCLSGKGFICTAH